MIVNWYAPNERGFAFSVVYTSANVMACLIPALVTLSVQQAGWQSLFLGVGVVITIIGVLLAPWLADKPQANTHQRHPMRRRSFTACDEIDSEVHHPGESIIEEWRDDKADAWTVLGSLPVWIAGLNMFFLYGVRLGFEGWMGSYLTDRFTPQQSSSSLVDWISDLWRYPERYRYMLPAVFSTQKSASEPPLETATDIAAAATQSAMVWWNAGGVVFTALVGPLSDRFQAGPSVMALALSVALVASTLGLHHTRIDQNTVQYALPAMAFISGGAVYGQRVLMVMLCRASVPRSVGGKADALMSVLAESGGVMAGFPMIKLVTLLEDWGVYTTTLSVLAALMLMMNMLLAWFSLAAPPRRGGLAAKAKAE